ncbi:MAG: GTP cyclohydrolase I FolE [Oscillospiraceae bacterium]|nr:GTP cyclohydrolase I FolE [Oscillospiraceae bacterium]
MNKKKIEQAIHQILLAIGEDPQREGLLDTPQRVASMYAELFAGLHEDPAQHLVMFTQEGGSEPVIVRDIPFYSMCEHHLLPFFGHAHIAYVPIGGRVIGLSKLARIVQCYARRPQLQERMTAQIADFLHMGMPCAGVAVQVEAEHLCMSMRGAGAMGARTMTSATRGEIACSFFEKKEPKKL